MPLDDLEYSAYIQSSAMLLNKQERNPWNFPVLTIKPVNQIQFPTFNRLQGRAAGLSKRGIETDRGHAHWHYLD